jgi:hypothetical protein
MCIIQIPTISGIHSLTMFSNSETVVEQRRFPGILTTWVLRWREYRGVSKATAMAIPSP